MNEQDILENKELFISLISSIGREGADIEGLLKKLENSDFYVAPASATHHNSFPGGLCAHSLNVYNMLVSLLNVVYPPMISEEDGESVSTCPYSEDTVKIVSLLHDFDKMNKYERTVQNKKVYSDSGSKHDEMGRFDWVAVPGFKRRDAKDRFIFGTHGENSLFMVETFFPLSVEERAAILNHHSVYDNPKLDLSVYDRYPLSCLLHLADMMSTYLLERTHE